MLIPIDSPTHMGLLIRAARKAQGIRQDDAAGSIGVSENFLGKVERGAESVHWGKLFQVLHGLGLRISVDVPDYIAPAAKPLSESLAARTGGTSRPGVQD